MIAKIEHYFIAEERSSITWEDRLYFYGVHLITAAVLIGLIWKVDL